MLKNLKIYAKLILGFSAIIIISAVIMIFALTNLKTVGSLTHKMYEIPFTVSTNAKGIQSEVNNMSREMRGIMLDKDVNSFEASINASATKIEEYIAIIKPIFLGEPILLTNLEKNYNNLSQIRKSIIETANSGDYEKATKRLKEEYRPAFQIVSDDANKVYESAKGKAIGFDTTSSQTVDTSITILITLFIVMLVVSAIITVITINAITKPINKLKYAANQIADGQLNVDIANTSKDEIGQLSQAVKITALRLKDYIKYIDEITIILNQIANGNLTFKLKHEYTGEFSKIKTALLNISTSLNDTLSKINESAEQVAGGSKQVSEGAQSLAQGATDEASVIEQLVASINEVSEKVDKNADNAKKAEEISESTNDTVLSGSEQMNQVVNAMDDIQENTNKIQVIVKTIEGIATQTNLLSLNAAIEAARAGEAGAGFAVVANEIGKLADESGKATKNTITLVEKCLSAAQNGSYTVNQASNSLNKIVESTKESKITIKSIKVASDEQSESLKQIVQGIEQVSTVMESNSAISQESAATSEELSGQAEILKNLVNRFTLKI